MKRRANARLGTRSSITLLFLALCAPVGADAPPRRYQVFDFATPDPADDTVLDARTGLLWQRVSDGRKYTQTSALTHCSGKSIAGRSGFRLPTRRELLSLVDYTRASPAIDSKAFSGTESDSFWSATVSPAQSDQAWSIDFELGVPRMSGRTDTYFVRCVRAQ